MQKFPACKYLRFCSISEIQILRKQSLVKDHNPYKLTWFWIHKCMLGLQFIKTLRSILLCHMNDIQEYPQREKLTKGVFSCRQSMTFQDIRGYFSFRVLKAAPCFPRSVLCIHQLEREDGVSCFPQTFLGRISFSSGVDQNPSFSPFNQFAHTLMRIQNVLEE